MNISVRSGHESEGTFREGEWVSLVYLVCLVYFVYLVCFVCLVYTVNNV